ncbi:hypothetical protein Pmani_013152 [Petrolisthes manimaculis]|uniref:Uncharacterized protein n=1 Tax=Petrolisthes manimaculis TaxID=1843537 RepID=A0AAE1PWH9_9EUCA|nr:hypothetical protein Pmani_013152 [Petrolisthes manimaculis]
MAHYSHWSRDVKVIPEVHLATANIVSLKYIITQKVKCHMVLMHKVTSCIRSGKKIKINSGKANSAPVAPLRKQESGTPPKEALTPSPM